MSSLWRVKIKKSRKFRTGNFLLFKNLLIKYNIFLIFIFQNGTTLRKNSSSGNGEYWACSKCTLKNPQRSNQCRACEQHRKLPKWFKCSVCTYENGPGRKTCEMCDTNLKEARIKTPIPTLLGKYTRDSI